MSIKELLEENSYKLFCQSIVQAEPGDSWEDGARAANDNSSVIIGQDSVAGINAAVVGITTNGDAQSAVLGDGSSAGVGGVSIGQNVLGTHIGAVVIGRGAESRLDGDICLGSTAGGTDTFGAGRLRIAGTVPPVVSATAADRGIQFTYNGQILYLRCSTAP